MAAHRAAKTADAPIAKLTRPRLAADDSSSSDDGDRDGDRERRRESDADDGDRVETSDLEWHRRACAEASRAARITPALRLGRACLNLCAMLEARGLRSPAWEWAFADAATTTETTTAVRAVGSVASALGAHRDAHGTVAEDEVAEAFGDALHRGAARRGRRLDACLDFEAEPDGSRATARTTRVAVIMRDDDDDGDGDGDGDDAEPATRGHLAQRLCEEWNPFVDRPTAPTRARPRAKKGAAAAAAAASSSTDETRRVVVAAAAASAGEEDGRAWVEVRAPRRDVTDLLLCEDAVQPSNRALLARLCAHLEIFAFDELARDVARHALVPPQRLATAVEIAALGLPPMDLPEIPRLDRMARHLGARVGDVVITRRRTPARDGGPAVVVYYRRVV